MDLITKLGGVDLVNLQAIEFLEKLGNSHPNEEQIAIMEIFIQAAVRGNLYSLLLNKSSLFAH